MIDEFPEEFTTIAQKVMFDAKRAGIKLVTHTMICPACERFDDPDMTVKMCEAAKELHKTYRDAYNIALPYMAIIEAAA